jgi:hypothetical protein
MRKRAPQSAPVVDRLQRRFGVTHPFHPRTGETFALVRYHRSGSGQASIDGLDDEGRVCTVPLAWTDAGAEDPYRVVSNGRSYGRVRELLRLAELLEGLRQ